MVALSQNPLVGPFCALMASVTWAWGSTVYGGLAKKNSPFAVNFARASVALPLYLILALTTVSHSFHDVTRAQFGWFTVSMMSSYAFADSLFILSTRSLGIPAALAISSIYPLWSALAGWYLRGESLGAGRALGLLFVVIGTILVILSQRGKVPESDGHLHKPVVGVTLAFLTSLLWALNTLAVSEAGANLPASVSNCIRMGIAFVLCPVFGSLFYGRAKVFIARSEFIASLPVFLVESFAGSFFYVYGLTHSTLAVGASLASLSPVIAVPVAFVMGWERPSLMRSLGIVSVVAGVCLLVAN